MTRFPGIALLLILAACRTYPLSKDQGRPAADPADTRDLALGPNAAEPAWRDLTRHTMLQGSSRATHPGPSPDGKVVAYATTEFGPHSQIALRPVNGVAATQLTHNNGENLFPRISPDGRLLAYCSNKDGNFDIYVARLDAPASVSQITFEAADDIAPSWSPDGRHLVYCTRVDAGFWQLAMVDVASRVKTFLGPGLYPDWSPDPKDPWISFQSQPRTPEGRSSVWVVRPDGTQLREVVSDKAGVWSALNPRFSPDGRWIAYATVKRSSEARTFGAADEADDIWVIRPDGTLDTRLTDDLSAEWWPAWGGNRVFFVSTRDGARNIYSIQPKPLEEEK
jgi:TolB protein